MGPEDNAPFSDDNLDVLSSVMNQDSYLAMPKFSDKIIRHNNLQERLFPQLKKAMTVSKGTILNHSYIVYKFKYQTKLSRRKKSR